MSEGNKIGRNKKCCFVKSNLRGSIEKDNNSTHNLSGKERNLLFLERIADALQFDKIGNNWHDIKVACTPV